MNCPSCYHKKFLFCKIKLPTYEHRNLTKISDFIILKQCKNCSLIYNTNIKNILVAQKKIFLSNKDYNFTLKKNKISALKDSAYAKEIFDLSNTFNSQVKNLNVLDIGALQGNVLRQLRKNFNKDKTMNNQLNFVGYNYSNKKNFYCNSSFIINSLKIDECFKNNKSYNIIISINSLQYVKKLNQFLLRIKNSLVEANSFAFFVVPNSLDNISCIFHGDEFYKFTKKNISTSFALNDLKVHFLKNDANPGHLMFYVKKKKYIKNILRFKNFSLELPVIENRINNFLTLVNKVSFKFKSNVIKIFGYRINAIILYHTLIKFHFNEEKIFFITDDKLSLEAKLNNSMILKKLIVYSKYNFQKIGNLSSPGEKIILFYGSKRNNTFKKILHKKYNLKNFISI